MNMRRTAASVVLGLLITGLTALPARADGTYHSQRIALTPVGDAQLRTGFVENIHVNGPNVYAHENYVLNGADADVSYQVTLSIWAANTECSGEPTLQIDTAVLTTNVAGNAKAQAVFTPEDADGLRGSTVSGMWTVSAGTTVVYATDCEVLQLD
jgi:hypothetical protein